MVIFERLPYRRPQWERLSQQITEGVKQFQDAPCWEDAYFSLLELDAPRRLFMTMAVLCEAHNTGDTPLWKFRLPPKSVRQSERNFAYCRCTCSHIVSRSAAG